MTEPQPDAVARLHTELVFAEEGMSMVMVTNVDTGEVFVGFDGVPWPDEERP